MATWSRRALLRGISAGIVATVSRKMYAHPGPGPVDTPLPRIDAWVINQDGQRRQLQDVLQGGVTALQTIFTGCSSVCPLQGALFGAVQEGLPRLRASHPLRLVSLSIDPMSDTPEVLRAWLRSMGAGASWSAATPIGDVAQIRTVLAGRPPAPDLDLHATQVYFFNRGAQLCWRSQPMPPAAEVLRILANLAA